MSYYFNAHSKLCVTCEYWVGNRIPNQWGSGLTVEDQSVKGKCWCLNGPHARADRYSNNTTCFNYKKWSVLN